MEEVKRVGVAKFRWPFVTEEKARKGGSLLNLKRQAAKSDLHFLTP